MTAPPHAKYYEGKPKYKLNFISKQRYQQLACSAGCKTQTQTYCRCNLCKLICKHCHVKHIVIKIMIPESIEKTAPCQAVTKTARAAFIHRINMTQKLTRVRNILLTTTRILPPLLTQ